MIRKWAKRLLQITLITLAIGVVGLVLLAFAFVLPTDRIFVHVKESVPVLLDETDYFSIVPGIDGTRLDNGTDAIYLNQSLVNIKNAGLMDCVLSGYTFVPEEKVTGPVLKLAKVSDNPENSTLFDETKRFYNGYEVVVKLLLCFTNYSGIRQFNMYVGLLLTLVLFYLMIRRGLKQYMIPFVVSLLFIRPLTLTLNMTFFGFYVCMLVPCIVILLAEKETLKERAWLLFCVTGAVTYYFNMNYIQLLSFAIPVLFVYITSGIPEKPFKLVKDTAFWFLAWGMGCVGMMVFKWIVYAVFIDANIFTQMLSQFLFRTGSDGVSRTSAIVINAETAFGNPWWNLLEIIFIGATVFKWLKTKKIPAFTLSEVYLFILMAFLTFARFLILSNHVINHNWVTYRLLMIPVMAFNILISKQETDQESLLNL